MKWLDMITMELWKWYKNHSGNPNAHHTKYTNSNATGAMGTKGDDNPLHHDKYTDTEAVTAVATADDYVKNTGDTITGNYTITLGHFTMDWGTITLNRGNLIIKTPSNPSFTAINTTHNYEWRFGVYGALDKLAFTRTGVLVFAEFNNESAGNKFIKFNTKLDMTNHVVKDQKNHAASALSGTKKLVEIDIGGSSYYYEVYPTKA